MANADLPERGLIDLRFHASLCARQGMDGIPAFVRPGPGADMLRNRADLLPFPRLVPGKAKLAPHYSCRRLGELHLDGLPAAVSLHRPAVRSRPRARHVAELPLAAERGDGPSRCQPARTSRAGLRLH